VIDVADRCERGLIIVERSSGFVEPIKTGMKRTVLAAMVSVLLYVGLA
jgi:hypothetical protein